MQKACDHCGKRYSVSSSSAEQTMKFCTLKCEKKAAKEIKL